MNTLLRSAVLLGVLTLVTAVVGAPAAAQCPSARVFGGDGGGMFEPKLNVLTNGTENAGNEVGYFWENGTSNDNFGGGGVGCPSSLWWILSGPDRRIQGAIATPTCQMDLCPDFGATLNWVVEDATADGADAGMIMIQVDETPATFRWWDHARITPGWIPNNGATTGGAYSVEMQRYPTVDITGTSSPPPNTTVTAKYLNLALNYHGRTDGIANTALPASAGIASYDIMGHHAGSPPGRARASWNLGILDQIPYADAAVSGHQIAVPCPNLIGNTWLGVAVEFVDGMKSALVGRAQGVSCDPNIADPDDDENKLRPKTRVKKIG